MASLSTFMIGQSVNVHDRPVCQRLQHGESVNDYSMASLSTLSDRPVCQRYQIGQSVNGYTASLSTDTRPVCQRRDNGVIGWDNGVIGWDNIDIGVNSRCCLEAKLQGL